MQCITVNPNPQQYLFLTTEQAENTGERTVQKHIVQWRLFTVTLSIGECVKRAAGPADPGVAEKTRPTGKHTKLGGGKVLSGASGCSQWR